MAEGERSPTAKPQPKESDAPMSREDKLAKALRDNLKRRKAKKD